MTQSTQGIIIALLICLLVGVIIGFYLRQSRINDLSKALNQQKKRSEEIEQEHEKRLKEATLQLQKDYEQQLAEKIELYQSQYDDQVNQLEGEYNARLSMMGPAAAGADPANLGAAVMGAGASPEAAAIEQRIRKQYETRLKEAAQKIQQAYEQHLKLKLNEARDALQNDYEQRLAEKIAHYQDQFEAQLAQAAPSVPPAMGAMALSSDPITTGSGTPSNAFTALEQRDQIETELRREYEQKLAEKIEHYQNDMAQRLETLEQEYEARASMISPSTPERSPAVAEPTVAEQASLEENLRIQIEEQYKADYEQRLAEALERYQDEMVQRTQELEQEYEARLQLLQQAAPAAPPQGLTPDASTVAADLSPAPIDPATAAPPTEPIFPPVDMPSPQSTGPQGARFEEESSTADAFSEGLDLSEFGSAYITDEPSPDFDLGEPETTSEPVSDPTQDDSLDLDDLLTLEQGNDMVEGRPPIDDGGLDLDNLETLLQDQEDNDADNIFDDNLDDLSNLS